MKYCSKSCREIKHKELTLIWQKNNCDKVNAKAKKYFQTAKGKATLKRYVSSEKGKLLMKRYYDSEKGQQNIKRKRKKTIERSKIWQQNNRERQRQIVKKYRQTEKGRIQNIKNHAARRELKSIFLNQRTAELDCGHHVDDNYVLFIPTELHIRCNCPNRELHRQRVAELLKAERPDLYSLIDLKEKKEIISLPTLSA